MDSKPKTISNPRRLLILTPTTAAGTAASTATTTDTYTAADKAPAANAVPTIDPVTTIPPLLSALTGESINEDNLQHEIPIESVETDTNNNNNNKNERKTKTSFAGYTTHAPLRIETRYYTADVPIWVDEIVSPPSVETTETTEKEEEEEEEEKGQWKTEFLSDEAQVVRDAIGALLVCARNPVAPSKAIPAEAYNNHSPETEKNENNKHAQIIKNTVRIINEVKQKTEEERDGGMGEVPGLLVLLNDNSNTTGKPARETQDDNGYQPEQVELFSAAWWEDTLYEMDIIGFEVILWDPASPETNPTARNEFGELQGLPRIKEVLSALEWGSPSADEDDDNDADTEKFLADMGDDGLGVEVGQLEREMMGLRFAINNNGNDNDYDDDDNNDNDGGDSELQVDDLEALMMRMRSIKDMSADLPEAQRKAFAAKAVRDIMREL
ncbi:uncharacterized protein TRUGW13939_11378 [Talaromyces rugulosus]|uniref:Alpha and gamma adaptin binding protein p34 n=1 Tax=Talaromyces rugulosus TaxID=121627 RepID=A0A7H8RF73_TALRU|nr:uncharacterized protein TRUGW13939_11378 [Talaromyces rugulosus]QKX64205.1 hypothetical protein TRUGW13939_11378 [Talaromyces rugulosus]